jgi:EAL domain-containing protein (putative c-di-GMP-specific phosphodiesterase class I)/GGDEF domain-containing protein
VKPTSDSAPVSHERLRRPLRSSIAGLLARHELDLELSRAVERAAYRRRPLSVIWLTVVHAPSQALGHGVSEALQRSCAERIAARLGDHDTLAHLGGLEFAVLLGGVEHLTDIPSQAHGLLDAFRRPLLAGTGPLPVIATAGIAVYPCDGESPTDLLVAAQRAARRAAEGEAGTIAFSSAELDADEQRLRDVRQGLGGALERDELVLHYQPVLDLRRGEVAAVEALVRWRHPRRGLILPLDFIPAAESTGQIVEIGAWALSEACRQARAWELTGIAVRMAVNLSARQFAAPGLVESVEQTLRETGLKPGMLELELTESMFADPDTSTTILERLHKLGVRVAIDDFGTGFSSLSYLTRFPLSTIKIDRSFIVQATREPHAAAVVTSVIAMAHELDLLVVAEGVETDDQEHFLVTRGCDLLQGFLHSHPLPAEACETWLRQRATRQLTSIPGGADLSGQTRPRSALARVADRRRISG